jgi:pectate lyase
MKRIGSICLAVLFLLAAASVGLSSDKAGTYSSAAKWARASTGTHSSTGGRSKQNSAIVTKKAVHKKTTVSGLVKSLIPSALK